MTSQLVDPVNPLTELPVVGGVVEVVHSLLTDLGIPLWMAESIELTAVLVGMYLVLRTLLGRVVPWLVAAGEPGVGWFLDRLAMILLLPEFAVTRLRTAAGRPPFGLAYSYGDGVMSLTRVATVVAHTVVRALLLLPRVPRVVSVALALLLVLTWNSTTCALAGPAGACVSPAEHWITEAGHWFTTQDL
jgi:hypothetical protein